jgi:hypothetical protein
MSQSNEDGSMGQASVAARRAASQLRHGRPALPDERTRRLSVAVQRQDGGSLAGQSCSEDASEIAMSGAFL